VEDFKKTYQTYVFKGLIKKNLNGLKVAVDCGNGMGSVLVPLWAQKLPVMFSPLFTELDGRFPNRGSDPTLKKNQRAIFRVLAEGGYDFGVALDGDSDRIAFFDERGRYVNSAIIGAIVAEVLLAQSPGEKIVYTTLTSRILKDSILKAGGVPVLARVGHAFIKETMRKEGVLFGAEHSGHFYFKDYFYTDSVTLTLRAVLTAYGKARRVGIPFSDFIAPYQVYYQTEDTIAPAARPEVALEAVRTFLAEQKPKQLKRYDGYMVDFGDVWGSVKVSVTEPALKFMFESQSKTRAESVKKAVQTFIIQFEKGSQDV
jgi:phosphomannomutase